jgi:phenylacetate-CoA ligase
MLIVRGVNVFPSAIREIVDRFAPAVSGVISVRPSRRGFRQDPPLRVVVEHGGTAASPDLADRIRTALRETLLVTTAIDLVAPGTLPRSDYKSKLVDWSEARPAED